MAKPHAKAVLPSASRIIRNIGIPARNARVAAFDDLRGFIVALVVLHHSILAYCRFGRLDHTHYLWSTAPIVDAQRWIGFDLVVLINDSFFMPLMFLVSGLFVWQSMVRKGVRRYLRNRLLRLGLPLAVVVVTVVPLAYYPSFRLAGGTAGFGRFWIDTILVGPWPAGPPWFVGVLLAFDSTTALLFGIFGEAGFPDHSRLRALNAASATGRHDAGGAPATPGSTLAISSDLRQSRRPRPAMDFVLLLALSTIGYLPLLALNGPVRWFSFGPFAVQASRIGLYAVYFAAGVLFGRRGIRSSGVTGDDALPRQWARWVTLAGGTMLPLVAIQTSRLHAPAALPPAAWSGLGGMAMVTFCAAACFAWIAVFRRFRRTRHAIWESLGVNAYGIFLLHYPFVTWLQYALLGVRADALAKASAVFCCALSLSWGATILVRRVPGVARII